MKKQKNQGADWVGPRPDDDKPILYFSGYTCETKAEIPVMSRSKLRYRCFSYAFLGEKAPFPRTNTRAALEWCKEQGTRLFLDSGAFSFHTSKMLSKVTNIDEYVDAYARYVIQTKERGIKWDFFVTFDHVKVAPEVYRVTKKLEKEYGLRSVPVYHGDSSLDWFRRYVDEGHKLICVGRVKALGSMGLRRYYETIFEEADKLGGIKLHGLMVTGVNMFKLPWFSVDSATWTRLAANGRLLTIDRRRKKIGHFRVSRVHIPTALRELIEANGFDPHLVATSPEERAVYNIVEFMRASHQDPAYLKAQARWQPII